MSFKDVEDDDIEQVEIAMQKINPAFKFRPGDKKLIKSTAEHVKNIVDGNGKFTGLSYFNDRNNPPAKSPVKKNQRTSIQNTLFSQ